MSIKTRTIKFVKEFFERYPLPEGWFWVVYTTNAVTHGHIISNNLVLYTNEKPLNNREARKRKDCVVKTLPFHPGQYHSPGIEVACKAAMLDLVRSGNLDV